MQELFQIGRSIINPECDNCTKYNKNSKDKVSFATVFYNASNELKEFVKDGFLEKSKEDELKRLCTNQNSIFRIYQLKYLNNECIVDAHALDFSLQPFVIMNNEKLTPLVHHFMNYFGYKQIPLMHFVPMSNNKEYCESDTYDLSDWIPFMYEHKESHEFTDETFWYQKKEYFYRDYKNFYQNGFNKMSWCLAVNNKIEDPNYGSFGVIIGNDLFCVNNCIKAFKIIDRKYANLQSICDTLGTKFVSRFDIDYFLTILVLNLYYPEEDFSQPYSYNNKSSLFKKYLYPFALTNRYMNYDEEQRNYMSKFIIKKNI